MWEGHAEQLVDKFITIAFYSKVAHSADRHLQEIDKQYPGFVNMKSHAGLQYSYELQVVLQKLDDSSIVRGYR